MDIILNKLVIPILLALMYQVMEIRGELSGVLAKVNIIAPVSIETHDEQGRRLDIIKWSRLHREEVEEHNHTTDHKPEDKL